MLDANEERPKALEKSSAQKALEALYDCLQQILEKKEELGIEQDELMECIKVYPTDTGYKTSFKAKVTEVKAITVIEVTLHKTLSTVLALKDTLEKVAAPVLLPETQLAIDSDEVKEALLFDQDFDDDDEKELVTVSSSKGKGKRKRKKQHEQ